MNKITAWRSNRTTKLVIAITLIFVIILQIIVLVHLFSRNSFTITVINKSHDNITVTSGLGTIKLFDTTDISAGTTKKIKFETPITSETAYYFVSFEEVDTMFFYRIMFYITDYTLWSEMAIHQFNKDYNGDLRFDAEVVGKKEIRVTISTNTDG